MDFESYSNNEKKTVKEALAKVGLDNIEINDLYQDTTRTNGITETSVTYGFTTNTIKADSQAHFITVNNTVTIYIMNMDEETGQLNNKDIIDAMISIGYDLTINPYPNQALKITFEFNKTAGFVV